jgi:tripartite-type tricarboxylate transporter receptor subunit TctC
MSHWHRLAASVLVFAGLSNFVPARAQDYPTRPVFIVVGPGPDTMARLFGQKLSEAWGQQVLVDPQPTGGGVVAMRTVARAQPDGHTMLLTTGSYTINEALRPNLPVMLLRDFEPVASIGTLSFILITNPALPIKSVADLVKTARERPGQLNCASSGVGTTAHLGCEMLKRVANVDIVHVPYKGAGPALVDLLGGRVEVTFSVPTIMEQVKSGQVRALAVTGPKRLAALPDVPTVAEAGFADLEFGSWNGLHVTVGTPKPIVEKINAAIAKARELPDIRQRMADLGFTPEGGTPAEFGEFVKRDLGRWNKVVKETGVKLD